MEKRTEKEEKQVYVHTEHYGKWKIIFAKNDRIFKYTWHGRSARPTL